MGPQRGGPGGRGGPAAVVAAADAAAVGALKDQLMAPVISVRDLVKTYIVGEVDGPRAARREPRRRARRVRGGHRTVGLRQVDAHAHPRLPRSADERAVLPRRQGRLADVEGRARGRPQPEDRLRVPGLQPAVAHDGARQRRAAAALQRRREDEDGRAAPARDGGARRPSASASASTTIPTSCRAASSSASPSRARSSTSRRSCWPTSRPATSTRAPASR